MSTNIFNASNVMAPTLNNGGSHHHGGLHLNHNHHHNPHSSRHHHPHPHPHPHNHHGMDPILFPTTPVGASNGSSNGTTILSQNSPTTAFPFPPPSPGYLSPASSTNITNQHLQHQLPSWLSPNPIMVASGKQLTSTLAKESTYSDNNNNELISMSPIHLTSASSKNFKLQAEDSKTRSNHHHHHHHHHQQQLNYHSNHENNNSKEMDENQQSAFKPATISIDSKEKLHQFSIDSPGTQNTCSPTMNKSLKTTTVQNNSNSQSDLTWPNSEHSKPPPPPSSSSSSSSSPFMLANTYLNGSSSSSSTSPNSYGSSGSVGTSSVVSHHLRPNPTSPSAFSYPHYLIPPIYSYYQQAAIAAAAAAAAAANQSPTTPTATTTNNTTASQPSINSPMSPFVVPNSPHGPHYPPPTISSPTTLSISSNNNNNNPNPNSIGSIFFHDSMFPSSSADQLLQSSSDSRRSKSDESPMEKSDKVNHKDLMPQIIDLTAKRKCDNNNGSIRGNSPTEVVEQQNIKNANDSNVSLKRKSPDCSLKQTTNSNDSLKVNAITSQSSSASLTSRKHRILKPPNINITETPCETTLRNGFHSAFLPSPLYSQHMSNHRLAQSLPYTSYLDHVPLSAPPIPQLHHSQSNNGNPNSNGAKCFEFPNEVSLLSTVVVNGGGGGGCSKESSSIINSLVSNNNQSGKCHRTSTCSTSASLSSATSILQKNNVIPNNRKSDIQHKPTTFPMPTNKPIANNKVVQGDNNQQLQQQQQQQKQKILNQDSSKSLTTSMTSNNVNGQNKKPSPTLNGGGGQFPEYFRKGSTIKLGDGNLKKIEELSTEDFIESATRNEKFRVELAEVISMKDKSNKKGNIRIGFLVGQTRAKVSLDSPLDHPFFVYQKGWSSCSPAATGKRYGLNCRRLNLGDIVVTLANKPLPPLPPPSSLPPTPTTPWNKSSQSSSSSLASSSSSLSSNHSSSSQTLLFNNTYPCPPPPPPPPPPAHSSHPKCSVQQQSNNCVLNLDSKRKSTNLEHQQDRVNKVDAVVVVDDDDEIDVENIDDDVLDKR